MLRNTVFLLTYLLSTLSSADSEQRIYSVENNLKNKGINIYERMKLYKIPAISIAVINKGKIDWVKSYNVTTEILVTPKTLFQAASISKPMTAVIALSLMENHQLHLDDNVNDVLTTWKVTDNQYTEKEKVTLRRLLTHTAGLTGPGRGFFGYFSTEQDIPNLIQILNGQKPANSEPVELNNIPGTICSYSGGGYLVIQKMIEDITQSDFSYLAKKIIFKPLEMYSSTFDLIRPNNNIASITKGHLEDGSVVPGDWNLYPETAAAGLWTTPSDLSKFIIEIQKSYAGKSNKILSRKMIETMLTKQLICSSWGLGLRVNYLKNNIIEFSFNGSNVGYISSFIGFTKTGQGAVIMINSDNGFKIIPEIMSSIAETYYWPIGW